MTFEVIQGGRESFEKPGEAMCGLGPYLICYPVTKITVSEAALSEPKPGFVQGRASTLGAVRALESLVEVRVVADQQVGEFMISAGATAYVQADGLAAGRRFKYPGAPISGLVLRDQEVVQLQIQSVVLVDDPKLLAPKFEIGLSDLGFAE
jgi:hypothetical protein